MKKYYILKTEVVSEEEYKSRKNEKVYLEIEIDESRFEKCNTLKDLIISLYCTRDLRESLIDVIFDTDEIVGRRALTFEIITGVLFEIKFDLIEYIDEYLIKIKYISYNFKHNLAVNI